MRLPSFSNDLSHFYPRRPTPLQIGFVQTPQTFSNIEESQGSDDPLYQSNGVFFSSIQAGRDGIGMASFAGTNAVFFKPGKSGRNAAI